MLSNKYQKTYFSMRRIFLKTFIPEFFWPKEVILNLVPIKIRNAPYSFGVKRSLVKGEYEKYERLLISKRIKPGEIIFEFGGSIGVLTSILAENVGPKGMIISIEASEAITNYSKIWLEKEPNIKVVNGFGFPVNKLLNKINVENFDESGGTLGGKLTYSLSGNLEAESQNVYDLNKLINKFGVIPNILVIDIEGSEKILVDQTPMFPAEIRMILIELHPYIYGQICMLSIIESINSEGFSLIESNADVFLFERI